MSNCSKIVGKSSEKHPRFFTHRSVPSDNIANIDEEY